MVALEINQSNMNEVRKADPAETHNKRESVPTRVGLKILLSSKTPKLVQIEDNFLIHNTRP